MSLASRAVVRRWDPGSSSLHAISITLVAIALASPAAAQEARHSYSVTGNVTIASTFVSRGLTLSNGNPAIQGGVDLTHDGGFYLGTWASSASILADLGASNAMEWDFYGGFRTGFGELAFDLGATYFYYPGSYPDGWVSADTAELNLAASWKLLSLKYSYSLTNQFGFQTPEGNGTEGSSYLDASATLPVGAGFAVAAHLGHQDIRGYSDASYTDWKLGLTKDALGLSFGLAYVGTDARGDPGEPYHNPQGNDLGADRYLLTVGKSF